MLFIIFCYLKLFHSFILNIYIFVIVSPDKKSNAGMLPTKVMSKTAGDHHKVSLQLTFWGTLLVLLQCLGPPTPPTTYFGAFDDILWILFWDDIVAENVGS